MRGIAMIVTAVLATPCAILLVIPIQYIVDVLRGTPLSYHPTLGYWLSLPPMALMMSAPGAMLAFPASVANVAIVECFVIYKKDSWLMSALSGGIVGLGIYGLLFRSMMPSMFSDVASVPGMILAGSAMGVLYWAIAVRPRRKLRLTQGLDG